MRVLGQEGKAQDRQPAAEDEDDDEQKDEDRNQSHAPQQGLDQPLLQPRVETHQPFFPLALLEELTLARVLRTMMMMNRMTPVAKRASRCSPLA